MKIKTINLTIIAAIAVVLLSGMAVAASEFSDVPSSHWAHDAISVLADKGIVDGMDNNEYQPDGTIKRSQFMKLLTCALNMYDDTVTALPQFKDTPAEEWYTRYVTSGVQGGIITRESNYFYPESAMTRKEAAIWIINGLRIESDTASDFVDLSADMNKTIGGAVEQGLISGYDDNTFRPNNVLTRAEAATLIRRALAIHNGEDIPTDNTHKDIPPATNVQEEQSMVKLWGYVKDSNNGDTIPYAAVTIGDNSVTADSTGRYEVNIMPGQYGAEATVQGNYYDYWKVITVNTTDTWFDILVDPTPNLIARRAYEQFLLYGSTSWKDCTFELMFIDDDDIPELAIRLKYGGAHMDGVLLYTYINNAVTPINDSTGSNMYGTYSTIGYKFRQGLIYVNDLSFGHYSEAILKVEGSTATVIQSNQTTDPSKSDLLGKGFAISDRGSDITERNVKMLFYNIYE